MDLDSSDAVILVWLGIAVAAVLVEIATLAFVGLYIALGAGAAALAAFLGGSLSVQLATFAVTGIVLLLITRPFLKQLLEAPDVPTNVAQVVGRRGIVTIPIDNDSNTGQIRIGTEYWTARLPDGAPHQIIPVDARVSVLVVEGVTARVLPLPDQVAGRVEPGGGTAPTQ